MPASWSTRQFSGSHQDAIRKSLAAEKPDHYWDVAYLPIDPADLGRSYEAVIRINSQSGKGGVTYLLERDLGLQLPRWLQIDFSRRVQAEAEASSSEISPEQIRTLFEQHYLEPAHGYRIGRFQLGHDSQESLRLELQTPHGTLQLCGEGEGAITALVNGWQRQTGMHIDVLDYSEHALTAGTESRAAAYVLLSVEGTRMCGVAVGRDVVNASLQAVINGAAQHQALRQSA